MIRYMAVDFDGTIVRQAFPEIGAAKTAVIEYVKKMQKAGVKFILWTCREDGDRAYLTEAVDYCRRHGIPPDAVNENPWVSFGRRKMYADIYIDDRAVSASEVCRAVAVCAGTVEVELSSPKKNKPDEISAVKKRIADFCEGKPGLFDAFEGFLSMRAAARKPVRTIRSTDNLIKALCRVTDGPDEMVSCVDDATAKGYLSFFDSWKGGLQTTSKKILRKNTSDPAKTYTNDFAFIEKQLLEATESETDENKNC